MNTKFVWERSEPKILGRAYTTEIKTVSLSVEYHLGTKAAGPLFGPVRYSPWDTKYTGMMITVSIRWYPYSQYRKSLSSLRRKHLLILNSYLDCLFSLSMVRKKPNLYQREIFPPTQHPCHHVCRSTNTLLASYNPSGDANTTVGLWLPLPMAYRSILCSSTPKSCATGCEYLCMGSGGLYPRARKGLYLKLYKHRKQQVNGTDTTRF